MSRTIRNEQAASQAMHAYAQRTQAGKHWQAPAPKRQANQKRAQSTIRAIVRAFGI